METIEKLKELINYRKELDLYKLESEEEMLVYMDNLTI
jgi:hypothetical protein